MTFISPGVHVILVYCTEIDGLLLTRGKSQSKKCQSDLECCCMIDATSNRGISLHIFTKEECKKYIHVMLCTSMDESFDDNILKIKTFQKALSPTHSVTVSDS